jgi:hypothetical protein
MGASLLSVYGDANNPWVVTSEVRRSCSAPYHQVDPAMTQMKPF